MGDEREGRRVSGLDSPYGTARYNLVISCIEKPYSLFRVIGFICITVNIWIYVQESRQEIYR